MDKILDWSKFKAFADNHFNMSQIMEFIFDMVENIVEKRKKCMLLAFPPLPRMLKASSPGNWELKPVIVWYGVNVQTYLTHS